MNLTRLTSTLGAGAVATIAAWSSWSHMVGVALTVGERSNVAYVMPLSVDGLLVVASAVMVDDKRSGLQPRMSAKVAFTIGVAASLGANVAHAHPTIGARMVAAWPALALLLVVEMLSRKGKRQVSGKNADLASSNPANLPVAEAAILPDASQVAPEPEGVSDVSEPVTVTPQRPSRKAPAAVTAASKVKAAAKRMPDASAAQIAAKAGVSESTARRHLAALEAASVASTFAPAPAQTNGYPILAEVTS